MTFRMFRANLNAIKISKHEEKESTSLRTLQRSFQMTGTSLYSLRENGQREMEDGFGVAELNERNIL